MKVKLFLFVLLLSPVLAIAASTKTAFQAGNIENGQSWPIDKNSGPASYYAEGNYGVVKFTCELNGEVDKYCRNGQVQATLYTGKNFTNEHNMPINLLRQGINGPFYWRLTDTGENVGNIKVLYLCGENVSIQCQGTQISE